MGKERIWAGYGLWAAIAVGLMGGLSCREDVAPVAHVRNFDGTVTVRQNDRAPAEPAREDQPLVEGNLVQTGPEGHALVEFRGQNRLQLEPDTTLLVQKSGASLAQFGAVLVAGRATASSSGQGVLLAVGMPFGLTELGATEASVDLSLSEGVVVRVGEVGVLTKEGERDTLTAGATLTVDGLIVDLTSPEAGVDLVLEPMPFVLLSNSRQAQIKRSGEERWRSPGKREVLGPGDAVRTRRAGSSKIQFGELAGLTLRSRTEMVFGEAAHGPAAHRASYDLRDGNVEVRLPRKQQLASRHSLAVAGLTLEIQPGLGEAAVEIDADGEKKARVMVRRGSVSLPDGTEAPAGTALTVENGQLVGGVQPLATSLINLRPGSSSVIYYQSNVPPVAFSWPEETGADGYELEVAAKKDFSRLLVHERVPQNAFVLDRFPPGRTYFRVRGRGDWARGTVLVQRKRDAPSRVKRRNFVDDTGEKTVVYFQKALPAITLRWQPVAGATSYRVKVFPDGEFEQPVLDESVTGTRAPFKEGDFAEGKFFWHQTALGADGKELQTGRMNTLRIAFDNAVTDLEIKSPASRARVTSGTVTARGEVEIGARLSINGHRVSLDRQGRFRQVIRLEKGENLIVFQTVAKDGVARYYTRAVFRR